MNRQIWANATELDKYTHLLPKLEMGDQLIFYNIDHDDQLYRLSNFLKEQYFGVKTHTPQFLKTYLKSHDSYIALCLEREKSIIGCICYAMSKGSYFGQDKNIHVGLIVCIHKKYRVTIYMVYCLKLQLIQYVIKIIHNYM